MSEALAIVEALAAEEERKLADRFPIGYARGLKSAVLHLRTGGAKAVREAIDYAIEKAGHGGVAYGEGLDGHPFWFGTDDYDRGFVAGLYRALKEAT